MEVFSFLCKECGGTFSLSAFSYYYALRTLSYWDICPVGNHACLISMRECSTDVPIAQLELPVPPLDIAAE